MARPRKYPIHTLEVGQSMLLLWQVDERGMRTDQKSVRNSICQEQRRFGKRFQTYGEPTGLRVVRVR